jgi:two-component system, cell cycle response regulator
VSPPTAPADRLPAGARLAMRALVGVALAGLALFALQTTVHPWGERRTAFFEDWVYNGVVLLSALSCLGRAALVREERGVWLSVGLGLAAWTAGEIHYSVALQDMADPPYPSLSDVFWLLFYPACYVALVLLVRARMAEFRSSLWLDGVVGALGASAVAAATLFQPVLHRTGGTFLSTATDLAYPTSDLILLGFVFGCMGLTGWRLGGDLGRLATGFAAIAVVDGLFLFLVSHGVDTDGTIFDILWPAATLLLASSAWRPSRGYRLRVGGWRILVLPSAFGLAAVGVLVVAQFLEVPAVAIGLAAATLVTAIVRMALTFHENLRMVEASRRDALTDALTGLGNRRKLISDLEALLAGPVYEEPHVLIAFDLDGFKGYNDAFGHPAGDALLARLGRNLERAVSSLGDSYRLGGDEFCALVKAGPLDAERVAAAATTALSDHGKGFEVGSSYGIVALPRETDDPALALQMADQRLYAHKGRQRRSTVSRQTRDVLLQVLHESQPDLHEHLHEVASLAVSVGRRLGMSDPELDDVARAAELHDVGKMAIPEQILQKPGPLDDTEWDLMRQHTIIGERILRAAPAMLTVAKLVRSSHESYDGSGYPDGLIGDEIPLGARVVAVCDAFHAMTSDRPYQGVVSDRDALDELRRVANRQFDPRVVQALCDELSVPRTAPALPSIALPAAAA